MEEMVETEDSNNCKIKLQLLLADYFAISAHFFNQLKILKTGSSQIICNFLHLRNFFRET